MEALHPNNNPPNTSGSSSSIFPIVESCRRERVIKATNKASEVNAAEPIAKPFPTAAVVLPAASNVSVLSLTSFPRPAISAIPPALSDTGPYASMVRPIAIVEIIPRAAIAIPIHTSHCA
jgi:hypothetical protein